MTIALVVRCLPAAAVGRALSLFLAFALCFDLNFHFAFFRFCFSWLPRLAALRRTTPAMQSPSSGSTPERAKTSPSCSRRVASRWPTCARRKRTGCALTSRRTRPSSSLPPGELVRRVWSWVLCVYLQGSILQGEDQDCVNIDVLFIYYNCIRLRRT